MPLDPIIMTIIVVLIQTAQGQREYARTVVRALLLYKILTNAMRRLAC